MAVEARTGEWYVIPVERVRQSIAELLSRSVHPYFPAYLFLRRLAARTGSASGLAPNWAELGRILEVPGAPVGKPFLRPFWRGQRSAGQEWLNDNLAGSFAPSSLRGVPLRIVETDAQGRFTLRPDHATLALEHLLFGERIPAAALGAFLLRDLALVNPPDSGPTAWSVVVDAFFTEYGYQDGPDEFDLLYDSDWQTGTAGSWLEAFPSTVPIDE